MMPTTVAEIAAVTGATPEGDIDLELLVSGKVEFDSRRLAAGDVFLAIAGERVDGHDFTDAARRAGAALVISTHPVPGGSLVVADPIEAITALARHNAARLSATVVGITGSSGKTSTKDLLRQVLAGHGVTVATPQSFNNELGHPYTVLLAGADTDFLVLETSARGIGHITHLTGIAPPRIGVVLNVGTAHLGEFGSVEAIAQAKGELVEALPPAGSGGVAVLNADDPRVAGMRGRTRAAIVTFGEAPHADVRAVDVTLDARARAAFTLSYKGETAPVTLRVLGAHQVSNAAAVAAVALCCGMSLPEVAGALSSAEPVSRWRMELTELPGGITVINDAYNANPESMGAALRALAVAAGGRRAVAVLGTMAELGPDSEAEHADIGRLAAQLGVELVLVVGEAARPMAAGFVEGPGTRGQARWLPDREAAATELLAAVRPGDVVLFKGSRSAGMEVLAESLIAAHGHTSSKDVRV